MNFCFNNFSELRCHGGITFPDLEPAAIVMLKNYMLLFPFIKITEEMTSFLVISDLQGKILEGHFKKFFKHSRRFKNPGPILQGRDDQ